MELTPAFIDRAAIHLVGMAHVASGPGRERQKGFSRTWDRFLPHLGEIANRTDERSSYGVKLHPTEYDEDSEFAYLAAVEVADLNAMPICMIGKALPASRYAVFTVRGGIEKLGEAFGYIYTTWLRESGWSLAHPFDLEYYDKRFRPDDQLDSEIDIYLPVRREE